MTHARTPDPKKERMTNKMRNEIIVKIHSYRCVKDPGTYYFDVS